MSRRPPSSRFASTSPLKKNTMESPTDLKISRRGLLIVGASSVATMAAAGEAAAATPAAAAATPANLPTGGVPTAKVAFEVNGKLQSLELDTRTTLLDALRE